MFIYILQLGRLIQYLILYLDILIKASRIWSYHGLMIEVLRLENFLILGLKLAAHWILISFSLYR